jgi:MORN repeat variant
MFKRHSINQSCCLCILTKAFLVCCFLHIQTFVCLAQNKTENGFKNGLWETYKNNGQTKVRCYYLRDTLHGEYMEFSTLTGRKSLEANYHEGVLNGVFRTYWESGEIWNEGFYQNGRLNGRFKFYERNGHLIYYLHYKNGMLDGLCESYYWNNNFGIKKVSEPIPLFGSILKVNILVLL